MANTPYQEVLRQVQSLSPADQKRLLTEVAEQLEALPEQTNSILQLQGLGKEIWRELDVQEIPPSGTCFVEWIDGLCSTKIGTTRGLVS